MELNELTNKIRGGEIDCNNQSHFFSILIKGFLWHLRNSLNIRNIPIPHIILNTGDETMMLQVKGQIQSLEPRENINEDYIYNIVPRCVVTPKGINLQSDQLSSPYSTGQYQIEVDDQLVTYVAEFRRMPIKLSVELKYIVDNFTDFLELVQQIITKQSYIKTFNIEYMGQNIHCSYNWPDSFDGEHLMEFDLATTENRNHMLSLDIEIESNIPIYDPKTSIPAHKRIAKISSEVEPVNVGEIENMNLTDEII